MATTVTSSPTGIVHLGECVEVCFSGTAAAGAIITKIAYQLENVTDGVTYDTEIADTEGDVCKDFKRDIEAVLKTQLLSSGAILNDGTAIKEFRINYGDAVYDTENCTSTITTGSSTESFKVVYSWPSFYDQWDLQSFGDGTDAVILTSRPDRYCQCGSDVITILSNAAGSVTIEHNGQSADLGIAFSEGVTHMEVNPRELGGIYSDVNEYTYFIAGTSKKYTATIGNCCDCNVPLKIHILEPIGGYSTPTFCLRSATASRERDSIIVDECIDASDAIFKTGTIINNKQRSTTLTVGNKFASEIGTKRWLNSLTSGLVAYIHFPIDETTNRWIKGRVSSSNTLYEDEEIIEFELQIIIE